jgi:cytochrome c oxidase assembly protein subunit 15
MRLTRFQRLAVTTTALTYLLIAVGGLVRASGAGLGCPDWPRCFGSWIPPTSATELPPQFDASQFNAARTWTEYLNRLLGVSVGLAILATALSAWRHHRHDARIVWPVVAAALLTGYEGWLGGRVVAHELAPWIVTAHLVVALVIVQLLLWATVCAFGDRAPAGPGSPPSRRLAWGAGAVTTLLLVQVALGTQVRGAVDDALGHGVPRAETLATVGTFDAVHRDLAALVTLGVIGVWLWVWSRHGRDRGLVRAASAAMALVSAQIVAGMTLTGLALPPAVQVAHLTLASLLLGALTMVVLLAWRPAGAAA